MLIDDVKIINAPSPTKNKRKERDPEMQSVAKGKQWFHCFAEGFAYEFAEKPSKQPRFPISELISR